MQLKFIPPTNRLELVDGNNHKELPPTVTVWLWDLDNEDYLRVHGSDASWIDGINVKYGQECHGDDLDIFLIPENQLKGIELDPYVRYPERVRLKMAQFVDVIAPGKNSNVWIMRSPVGLHFVKEKSECCIRDMSNVVVVDCTDTKTSLTECSCELDSWSIHDVVYTEKTILIYGVNTFNPVTSNIKDLIDISCSLIFGDKGAFSDEKRNIASILVPILGQHNIERMLSGVTKDGVIKLIQYRVAEVIPNGPGAVLAMQNKETLVSLFEGVYARYYVSIKGESALRDCWCDCDSYGRLVIHCGHTGRLSEVAEKYFGIVKSNNSNKYFDDLMGAAKAGLGM